MDQQAPQVSCVKLGTQGLEVSKLGLGCLGLTGAYNLPLDDEAGATVVMHAFRRGVTFFDTSDYYGPLTNEILLDKALKLLPREQVQVATKFGMRREHAASGLWGVCGRPEYVRACCEANLNRLGLDYIDLYYQHRVDTTVPIEDMIGELKKLVEEGKVRYIGRRRAPTRYGARTPCTQSLRMQMEWLPGFD